MDGEGQSPTPAHVMAALALAAAKLRFLLAYSNSPYRTAVLRVIRTILE